MGLFAVCAVALGFGFLGSIPLAGPVALITLSRAALGRFDEALRVARGAAVAEGIYAGLAFWGFTTFLARYTLIKPISHGATGLVLTALGIRFAFWREVAPKDERAHHGGTTLLGFSISALNPTLLLTWSAAVAFLYSKGLEQKSAAAAIPFGLCAALGVAGWFECLVALLRKYEGKLPRAAMTWLVRSMGILLVGLGLWSCVELARWLIDPRPTAQAGPLGGGPPCRSQPAHRWVSSAPSQGFRRTPRRPDVRSAMVALCRPDLSRPDARRCR